MSDGGISAGYGDGATGTGAGHHEGHADTAGLGAAPGPQAGLTEDAARAVLTGLVDEHLSGHDGLDRIYARMDEVADQQRQWIEGLSAQGLLDPPGQQGYEYAEDYEGEEPDVLDEFEQVLTDAVDRRMDATEQAEQAEMLVADRDSSFEALRDRLPLLRDERMALAVVHRAADLCHAWGQPDLVEMPEFVQVIEQVALASHADPSVLAGRAPTAPPNSNGNGNPGMYAPGHIQLEAAQGASAHERSNPRVDWGDRIVAAAERLRPRI